MRKLKKFKRYDEGGAVGAGSGDPFSYTDFSNRARNLRKPSEAAPIEERKPPAPAKETKVEKAAEAPPPAKTEKVEFPRVRDSAKDTSETSFDYPTQRGPSNRDDYEGSASPTSGGQTFKRAAPKTPKETKYGGEPINISTGASGFGKSSTSSAAPKAPKSASPDQIPGTDVKTPYEGEKIDNKNLGLKQLAQSTLGATAVGRGVGAGVRGAMGLGRMFESAVKPEGKGTGKFPEAKPEVEAVRTPAVERVKAAKIEGPPASARPKTPAEQMGLRETGPMERARKAKEEFEAAGKGAKDAADRSTKKAADEVAEEAAKRAASKRSTPDTRRFPNKGSATPSRPKARAEVKPSGNKFNRPVGEKRGPKTDEILEREGLPVKKGGKIPAFKKGGLVGRGDGCAQRGKTKGRMV